METENPLKEKSSPKLTKDNIGDTITKSGINMEDSVKVCPFCIQPMDDASTGEGILHTECGKGFYIIRVQ